MIQEYSYRLKGTYKIIHCGQCDELDFKKFWRKMKDKIAMAYVQRENEHHIYYTRLDKGYWSTFIKERI